MAKLAKRMSEVEASGIRRVFDLAAKIKNPCNLSIGQPDFDVPEPAKEAAIEACRAGFNKYTVTQGIPELREGIKAKLKARGWEPEDVIITSGVSGGLTLAVLAMVDAGDEVLVPDPYFLGYKQLLKLVGANPVYVDTYPDFRLSPERLERAATPRTKLLFLNSPANPTGAVASEADLKGIAEICRKRGISVISDEVYDAFSYDGPAPSITKFLPEALVLNGFSKIHGMTGWRLGYAAGPKELLREMLKLQQITFVCAPSITQKGALAALDLNTESQIASYRRKRDLIYEGLKGKFEVAKPAGAFYIFPKVPKGTDAEFVERAIAKECLIIPGSVFSERNTHFRISYATTEEQLRRGIDILTGLA
jgi:aspartate/methionine/tyrosine aminotransferase